MNKTPAAVLLAFEQALRSIHAAAGGDTRWLGLDLTMAQLKAVLLVVRSGGLPSRAIGEGLGIGASAVTPLVDRLVEHKLVRREDDPHDRRVVWVRPTPKGTALQEALMEANRTVITQVLDEIPGKERDTVEQALTVLLDSATRVLARYQEKVAR